jgi:serine/threonine protein kinase
MEIDGDGYAGGTLREIGALSELDHPNIIKMVDYTQKKIVLELMDQTLKRYIQRTDLTVPKIRWIMREILTGVAYLHDQNFMHRDLKPENILVRSAELKLADFGLSRHAVYPAAYTPRVITSWYRPPELLILEVVKDLPPIVYGPEVDMWSVGCIFANLLRATPIFTGSTAEDTLDQILSILPYDKQKSWPWDVLDKTYSPTGLAEVVPNVATASRRGLIEPIRSLALELLGELLSIDPTKRPTAAQALRHPFMTGDVEPV